MLWRCFSIYVALPYVMLCCCSDLTEATLTGAWLSIAAAVVMFLLLVLVSRKHAVCDKLNVYISIYRAHIAAAPVEAQQLGPTVLACCLAVSRSCQHSCQRKPHQS
jgi:hypothetical protein